METNHTHPEPGNIGHKLKTIREQKGIKIELVANHTKIRCQHLEAIENSIPYTEATLPPTYYRGYIRTYCQFFGISIKPFEDEIDRLHPLQAAPMLPQQEAVFQNEPTRSHFANTKIAQLTGLACLICFATLSYSIFSDSSSRLWPESPDQLSSASNTLIDIQGQDI